MNCIILGAGKIGLDLYFKCKKEKIFNKIFIFNLNKYSEGAFFCRKKKISCFHNGVIGALKELKKNELNIIYDATSANSNIKNEKILRKFLNKSYLINLTPSKVGNYMVPYNNQKIIQKKINLITCGGQSSIPLIIELKKYLKNKINYVELVSSISSVSAGKATRENINEYIHNTQKAIKFLTEIGNNKVIINLNPADPPVNMMNSIFFETKKTLNNLDIKKIKIAIKLVNNKIKKYIPGYNAKFFKTFKSNVFRVTVRVVGQGDYLPTYSGNLDIITSSAVYIGKLIYEKNNN
jgi:acetaldehyde dehydrogenase (acetylating)